MPKLIDSDHHNFMNVCCLIISFIRFSFSVSVSPFVLTRFVFAVFFPAICFFPSICSFAICYYCRSLSLCLSLPFVHECLARSPFFLLFLSISIPVLFLMQEIESKSTSNTERKRKPLMIQPLTIVVCTNYKRSIFRIDTVFKA